MILYIRAVLLYKHKVAAETAFYFSYCRITFIQLHNIRQMGAAHNKCNKCVCVCCLQIKHMLAVVPTCVPKPAML